MVRVVAVVALLACAVSGRAAAEPLRVSGACAGELVEAHVAALMGRDPFAGGASTLAVVVDIDRARGRVEARVQIGGAERRLAAAACDELADEIALVIALALWQADVPPREQPPPIDAASIDAASPAAVVPVVELRPPPAPRDDLVIPPTQRVMHDGPPPRASAHDVHVTAMYAYGNANVHGSYRLSAGAALRRGPLSLGAEVRYDWIAALDVGFSHFEVTRAALALAPCASLGPFSACGLAVASRSGNEITGPFITPMTSQTLNAAVGGRFALDCGLTEHASLRLQLDVEAPFTANRLPITIGSEWVSARSETWLAAGIDARFP